MGRAKAVEGALQHRGQLTAFAISASIFAVLLYLTITEYVNDPHDALLAGGLLAAAGGWRAGQAA